MVEGLGTLASSSVFEAMVEFSYPLQWQESHHESLENRRLFEEHIARFFNWLVEQLGYPTTPLQDRSLINMGQPAYWATKIIFMEEGLIAINSY